MEYHNYNKTPIDRIDEVLMKELEKLDCCNSENRITGPKKNTGYSNQSCHGKNLYYNTNNEKCDLKETGYTCKFKKNNNCCKPNNCSCEKFVQPDLSSYPLSMIYSPYQEFDDLYELEEGFNKGTIFRKLDYPFYMASCRGMKISEFNCGCDNNGGRR